MRFEKERLENLRINLKKCYAFKYENDNKRSGYLTSSMTSESNPFLKVLSKDLKTRFEKLDDDGEIKQTGFSVYTLKDIFFNIERVNYGSDTISNLELYCSEIEKEYAESQKNSAETQKANKTSIPKDNNTSDENEKIVHIKAKTVYIESQKTTPIQTKKNTDYTKKMLLGFGVIFCFIIIFSFFDKPKIKKDTIIENNDSITTQESNQTKNKRKTEITNVPIPEKRKKKEVNLKCCAKSKDKINKLTKDFKAKNKSNVDIAFLDTKLIILKQIDLSCTETDCNICMTIDNLNNEITNFSYTLIKNEGEKIKENRNYSNDYKENIQLLLKTLELSLYICERTDCLKEDCLSYREIYDNYSKTLN